MFSKELEDLIQATLEDGVLEENEKAALVNRAQNEGVDLAELEIYINSILQKRKREQQEHQEAAFAKIEQKKEESFGRRCPNCGKQVPPLAVKCDCGYEFTSQKSASSVQLLCDKIEEINKTTKQRPLEHNYQFQDRKEQKIRELISFFPVPNTKEDIIEFLALAAPNSKKKGGMFGSVGSRLGCLLPILIYITIAFSITTEGDARIGAIICTLLFGGLAVLAICLFVGRDTLAWNKNAKVWRAKFEQVLMKGRSLRGDADFQKQLDYFEQQIKK